MTGIEIAVAVYDVGFCIFHALFWRIFNWPGSLRPSGGVNVAITQTLNIVLGYVFLAYALAAMLAPFPALFLAGAGFWAIRAVLQPILFRIERRKNWAMTMLFAAGSGIHLTAGLT